MLATFSIILSGYCGLQVLFVAVIFAIAAVRVMRGKDRAGKNERVPVGETVLAVKETNGRKEVFQ